MNGNAGGRERLRVAINARRVAGPYGGGNQFANTLQTHLEEHGHHVVRELIPDLDLILILSPWDYVAPGRITSIAVSDIAKYAVRNPRTLIVHRINTCDEQRGIDGGVNRAVMQANRLADHTVFVSQFMADLYRGHGLDVSDRYSVIRNEADAAVFSPGGAVWDGMEKLRIVTHHWSTNPFKGFDVYERFDCMLAQPTYADRFAFTIIGNVPLGMEFRNTTLIAPLQGHELAAALKENHVYLTAARYEPGGNHPMEAIQVGLPVLHLNSGSLPEYCGAYGLEFDLANFADKLIEMRHRYAEIRRAVMTARFSGSSMAHRYEQLCRALVAARALVPEREQLRQRQEQSAGHAETWLARARKFIDRTLSVHALTGQGR